MKTVKIKRDSKLYWFAEHFGGWKDWNNNICSFRWALIRGCVLSLAIIAVIGNILGATGFVIYETLIDNQIPYPLILSIIGVPVFWAIALGGFACLIWAMVSLYELGYEWKRKKRNEEREPTVLGAVYTSWKKKLCHKVEIVD